MKLILNKNLKTIKGNATIISESILNENNLPAVKEIMAYLNEKTGRDFNLNSKSNRIPIEYQLIKGHAIEDFKKIIDLKVEEWKDVDAMLVYLKPNTLFAIQNFNKYLYQTKKKIMKNKKQEIIKKELDAIKQNLKDNHGIERIERHLNIGAQLIVKNIEARKNMYYGYKSKEEYFKNEKPLGYSTTAAANYIKMASNSDLVKRIYRETGEYNIHKIVKMITSNAKVN